MRGDQGGVSLKKLNHGLTRMGRMHTDFKLKNPFYRCSSVF